MGSASRFPSSMQPTGNTDVVIVGAGVSGLVAAFEMIKQGVPAISIRILEAQNYIGGRVQTIVHGKRSFDTGAHWLHGGTNNLFYKWLHRELKHELKKKLGAEHFSDLFIRDRLEHVWSVDPSGKLHKQSSFRSAGREITETLYKAFKQQNPNDDISLADLVRHHDSDLAKGFIRLIASTWMAISPKLISADEFYAEPAGSGGLQVKGGMGRITGAMASILQNMGVTISTGHEVVSVSKSLGQNFTLGCKTAQGFTSIETKTIYMTPSIGVLQSGAIGFDPPLPQAAQEIINSLQMASLKKIFFSLRARFFSERPNIQPDTRVDVRNVGDPVFVHCRTAGTNSMQIVGASADPKDINAILSFAPLNDFEAYLKEKPLFIDWDKPSFKGSYSTSKVGTQRPQDNIIQGGLVIGGEAFTSNENGASTVEGAAVSAQKAAEHVARFLGTSSPRHDLFDSSKKRPVFMGNTPIYGSTSASEHIL